MNFHDLQLNLHGLCGTYFRRCDTLHVRTYQTTYLHMYLFWGFSEGFERFLELEFHDLYVAEFGYIYYVRITH